jgi:hypothetical protein
MPKREDDQPKSGCRADCLHRAMVLSYRATKSEADQVRKIKRENACNGYATEGAEWDAGHPPLTFKQYLQSNAQRCRVVDMKTAARYTATGALTDAALAEMSIEDRNRYLDDAQEAKDLDDIEKGYSKPRTDFDKMVEVLKYWNHQ